jgi:hypothetical protein
MTASPAVRAIAVGIKMTTTIANFRHFGVHLSLSLNDTLELLIFFLLQAHDNLEVLRLGPLGGDEFPILLNAAHTCCEGLHCVHRRITRIKGQEWHNIDKSHDGFDLPKLTDC